MRLYVCRLWSIQSTCGCKLQKSSFKSKASTVSCNFFFLGGGGIETQLSTVKSYILETNSAVIVEIESVFEDFTALGARIPSRFVAFHSQMAPQTVLSFVRFGALRTHVFG